MPRTKKTRKPGPLAPAKRSSSNQPASIKKPKSKSGNCAGARNSLMDGSHNKSHAIKPKSGDARLGSKVKIDLFKSKTQKADKEPRLIPKFKSPAQELEYIENDKKLQVLLDKQEQGKLVSSDEQKYVNTLVQRHGVLCSLLGIDVEQEDDSEGTEEPLVEKDEDLLDKLESKFEY